MITDYGRHALYRNQKYESPIPLIDRPNAIKLLE